MSLRQDPWIRAFVARRVDGSYDVDDIVQDVFARAHDHLTGLRDEERAAAWIFQIARNVIIDFYRSAPRRREQPTDPFDVDVAEWLPPAAGHSDEQSELRRELSRCLRPLLQQLTPSFREALELTDLGGMSQADAARELGLSASGMKSRVQRARAQLSRELHHVCHLELDPRGGPLACEPVACAPAELPLLTRDDSLGANG